jgi:hypothetical protein
LTSGDRDASYGPPLINHSCLGELLAIYSRYRQTSGTQYSLAHDAAMLQVLTKVSRIACGVFKRDNYVDLSNYSAIAFECEELVRQANAFAQGQGPSGS